MDIASSIPSGETSAPISPDSIRRQTLNDQITAHIRERILAGDLKSGTRMVQADWADMLHVSRMPVRDAFLRLQSEGLLVTDASGLCVASLSEDDVRDAYELHGKALAMVAGRAARSRSEEGLQQLRTTHQEFLQAVADDDIALVVRLNNRFYRTLTRESHSPRLSVFVRMLATGTPLIAIRESPEWRDSIGANHGRLVAAVAAKDAATAASIAERHVREGADYVVTFLRRKGFWDTDSVSSA